MSASTVNWSMGFMNDEKAELLALVASSPKWVKRVQEAYGGVVNTGNFWGAPPHPGWVMVWRDAGPYHSSSFGRWVPPGDPAIHPVRIGERGHEGISPFQRHPHVIDEGYAIITTGTPPI